MGASPTAADPGAREKSAQSPDCPDATAAASRVLAASCCNAVLPRWAPSPFIAEHAPSTQLRAAPNNARSTRLYT